jgi:undecaprenyl-diphosphatase
MQQLVTIDLAALFWFQSIHNRWTDPLMKAITYLGAWWLLAGVVAVAFLLFLCAGMARTGIILVLVFGLAMLLGESVKRGVSRPRPDVANPLVQEKDANRSFPSGHALLSMMVYGSIAVALGRRSHHRSTKAFLAAGTALLVLVIGFSRLYLCSHFVTDVLGGWLAGGALLLLFTWADQPVAAGPLAVQSEPVQQDNQVRSASEGSIVPAASPNPAVKPGWWRRPVS